MRYNEIYEDSSSLDIEYYLTEGCGIFAYILSSFIPNSKIIILSDTDGEEWSEEIPYEVTHAAALHNGNLYDVRGERTLGNMIELDFPQGMAKRDTLTPEQFKTHFMDGTDDTPLYAPDQNDITKVSKYIKENPELFNVDLQETSTAGGTSAGGIATVVGGLGAGFAPDQEWRSIYSNKTVKNKKKSKPIILKR